MTVLPQFGSGHLPGKVPPGTIPPFHDTSTKSPMKEAPGLLSGKKHVQDAVGKGRGNEGWKSPHWGE